MSMDYVQPTRNFSINYVILDTIFLVIFVVLLFVKKRRVTAYWALAGGLLYFIVDFIGFYLIAQSREIYSYTDSISNANLLDPFGTGAVLFWMSMSYGIMDFAFIWLWLNNDSLKKEFTLYIVAQWTCLPWMSSLFDNMFEPSSLLSFMTTRGTGKYHGIMAVIMMIGYVGIIIYNLLQKDKERRAPIVRLFLIGFFAQFMWECLLLVFGIRSQNYGDDFIRELRTMLQNSLIETNLGMPYIYFIHRWVSSKWDEEGKKRVLIQEENVS